MRHFVLIIVLMFGVEAFATHPEAVYKNNQAVEFLTKEDHFAAYKALLKALELDPLDPAIQYNLGVSFLANEEFEKALKQFELADQLAEKANKSKFEELMFNSRFAAGIAATQLKRIPEALENYQRALDLKPDNEDTKKNIELLWQGQQGGEGEGESKDKDQEGKEGKSKKDQEKDQGDKKDDKEKKGPKPKPKPQPFKSKDLTPDQVRKILEELKAQEQKIRAQENEKDTKDSSNEKDW